MLGTGDGRCSHVGDDNKKGRPWLHLPFRFLAWYVRGAGCSRTFQRDCRSIAARRCMDGVGKTALCGDHDRRCGVLPDTNGTTHLLMKVKIAFTALALGIPLAGSAHAQ